MAESSLFEIDPGFHEFDDMIFIKNITQEKFENVKNFSLDPSDLLVVAYAKAGHTWTLNIIHAIRHAEEIERGELPPFKSNFMEWCDTSGQMNIDKIAKEPPPRVLKSHLPLSIFKKQLQEKPEIKLINIMRDPKDVLVSLFHFFKINKDLGLFTGNWDQFFELYISQKLPFGEVVSQMEEWYNFCTSRDNSLQIFYEDLKKDLRGGIKKISEFLGINLTKEQLNSIEKSTTFQNMSADVRFSFNNAEVFDNSRGKFMRKGVVGDWKNYFNDDQISSIENKLGIFKERYSAL